MTERRAFVAKSLPRSLFVGAIVLLVAGVVSLPLFPQPFITYYCSANVCPRETAGGIAIGYVLLVLGVLAAAIAGIMSLAARSRQARRRG